MSPIRLVSRLTRRCALKVVLSRVLARSLMARSRAAVLRDVGVGIVVAQEMRRVGAGVSTATA